MTHDFDTKGKKDMTGHHVARAAGIAERGGMLAALAAAIGCVAAILSAVPAQAVTAGDTPGGIVQWGVDDIHNASYPADDGPWVAAKAGGNGPKFPANVLVSITADGTFETVDADIDEVRDYETLPVPDDVEGEQVRAFGGLSYPMYHLAAVLADGSVRQWGSETLGVNGHWSPADLGGDGDPAEAIDVTASSQSMFVLLEDGRVGQASTSIPGGYEVVTDLDTGDVLTDATAISGNYHEEFVLREDGSVVLVPRSGGGWDVMIEADEEDPVVKIDKRVALRESGEVVAIGGDDVRNVPNVDGKIVDIACTDESRDACGLLTDDGRVTMFNGGSYNDIDDDFRAPDDIQGRVLSLNGAKVGFTAIVDDEDAGSGAVEVDSDASVDGTAEVGETLEGTPATFTGDPDSVENQWLAGDEGGEPADATPIEDGDGSELTLGDDLEGKMIYFQSTAHVEGEDDVVSTSEGLGPVETDDGDELKVVEDSDIEGVVAVGQTVTAVPAVVNDDDALVIFSWSVGGKSEGSANQDELELTEEMEGKKVQLTTQAIGDNGQVTSKSEAYTIKAALAVESDPEIDGKAQVGETLTGTPGEFNDDEADVENQWLADGDELDGETGKELELTADMLGKKITFQSTATRGDEEVTVDSKATDEVAKAPLKVDKDASISGTAVDGETLTGTPAEFNDDDVTVSNEWLADGEVIDDADGAELELTEDMVGKEITFKSTATRDDESESSESKAVEVKAADDGDGDGDGGKDGDGDKGPSDPGDNLKDKIGVKPSTTVHPGQDIAVTFDEDRAGDKVSIWMFSEKFDLGTHAVKDNGRVGVTVPEDIELGGHKIAAYDVDGDLIGSIDVDVVADNAGGPGAGEGGAGGALPSTGAEWATNVLAPVGVLLALAGGGLLLASRRRRQA